MLKTDILNDVQNGENYFAATNWDHRKETTETNLHDAKLVEVNPPHQAPRHLKLNYLNNASGDVMTRHGLTQPPWNANLYSQTWTTGGLKHGYLEIVVKLPSCERSKDGSCEKNTNPMEYNQGLWPSIRLFPTNDVNWPMNGEITLFEGYRKGSDFMVSDAKLHFFGVDPKCENNDCAKYGYTLPGITLKEPLFKEYHTWGFEWDADDNHDGILLTGYFDNEKFFGPINTKDLPGDGPRAFSDGFNDPNGGFYLALDLAVGGEYSGPLHPELLESAFYVSSIKSYRVLN